MNIEQLYTIFSLHPFISTDTRKIKKGSLFFALKGENFDGNKFAQDALNKGAAYAVIDDSSLKNKLNHIHVDDVLSCLQQLANHHRNQLSAKIIGITGTNGKTTTKELIAAVLQQKYNCSFTQGNLNNHIGVPLTLLAMTEATEIGVVEMGANHLGEIAELCQIAEPDFGLITNVGKAHLEGFGSFEGVVKTKSELYQFLAKRNKACFINCDNKILLEQATGLAQLTYGTTEKAQLKGSPEESGYTITVKALFPKGWLYLKSNLIGNYNFENILAAARIGIEFQVDPLNIQKAIANYLPSNNRSQLITKGTSRIIMDSYNANPTSMKAALMNFFEFNHSQKIVILGDMLELGKDSKPEHQKIVDLLEEQDLESILLVGSHFCETKTTTKTKKFEHVELLNTYLDKSKLSDGKLILIKGSRGIQLEKTLDSL